MKNIIIVDACEKDRMTASALLAGTYDVRCCASVDEATTLAMQKKPHAVIMDLATIRAAGHRDVRGAIGAIEPRAGAVCVATNAEVIHHVRAMGASGFAGKPYKVEALSSALRLAVAESVAEAASPWVVRAAATREWKGVHNRRLLGQSVAMRRVLDRIALYATHDAPVLILGESGTGKELAAAAIHRGSKRSGQRFLPVNCAAMPESLAESMLFGTLKGAFTDAVESKGVFESALGGTVFLDEIGELSLALQAKFLRTLETRSGSRVGSVDQTAYDVRIVSATNAALFENRNRFRPELIHRIDTLLLEMPALRDHKDDIPLLVASFMEEFSPHKKLDPAVLPMLLSWDWPGNVRELRNVILRASVLSGDRTNVLAEDIELDMLKHGRAPAGDSVSK